MGAVGHYLEAEGVATTQISLVREHTEAMQPPRALWVPFMLGRPLGAPNDPAFQSRVLRAALQLLEEPFGPVLRDYDEEAPGPLDAEAQGAACPVNFDRPAVARDAEDGLARALAEEIAQLEPWHDLAVRRRGGSTMGLSGLDPGAAGAFIASFLGSTAAANYRPQQPLAVSLKHACDDLRAFYEEAAGEQPGRMSAAGLENWFYMGTVAGEVFRALQGVCLLSEDAALRAFAQLTLVPRSIANRARGG